MKLFSRKSTDINILEIQELNLFFLSANQIRVIYPLRQLLIMVFFVFLENKFFSGEYK